MKDIVPKRRGSSALLILLVVFVFMICSLFLILFGANVYTSITKRSDSDFIRRMSTSYIINKIRACDVPGGIETEEGGTQLRLCANPDADLPIYIIIYFYEGFIMEYITDEPSEFDMENGERIVEASSLFIKIMTGIIKVSVGAAEEDITYTVSVRCS